VVVLIANDVVGRGAEFGIDTGDEALVIDYVARVALQGDGAEIVKFPVDLETAEIDALFGFETGGGLGDFAKALAASVVNVERALPCLRGTIGIRSVDGLAAGHLKLIPEIPLDGLELRHGGHVAVRIEIGRAS